MDIGPFAKMVQDKDVPRVVAGIEKAVIDSFMPDPNRRIILPGEMKRPTRAEQRQRVHICVDLFRTLRGDMKWSVSRIIDHLPGFLRQKLNGDDINLSDKSHWMPGEGV